MGIEQIVWDRLHSGFVYSEPGMVTYNPSLAKSFDGKSEDILATLLNGEPDTLRYTVLPKPIDNPKHPAYTTLDVGYAEFVQIRESGRDSDTPVIKQSEKHLMLAELGLIDSEQSIGCRYYWIYQNPKIGIIRQQFENSLQDAWLAAKDYARQQQCKRSASQQSKMFAFLRAIENSPMTFSERVAISPQAVPFEVALYGNPYHRVQKTALQVGDRYIMQGDDELCMHIRKAVRGMLNASRALFQRRQGKLAHIEKEDIRLAVEIMQNADFIEVVGVVHKQQFRLFTGASSIVSRGNAEYQLAYHATLNGMRQVAIPPA